MPARSPGRACLRRSDRDGSADRRRPWPRSEVRAACSSSLGRRIRRHSAPADISLVSTFAAQAASAIELFELRSAEHGVEVGAERQRIAGELHDGVVSALRDLQAGVRGLADGTDDARLAAGIGEAVAQLDGAIETIGGYVVELRGSAPRADPGGASPARATTDPSRSDTARRRASTEWPRQRPNDRRHR